MPGLPSVTVPGDAECEHVWGKYLRPGNCWGTPNSNSEANTGTNSGENTGVVPPTEQAYCQRCGAWRGELGLEPTPEMFVAHLVLVFREVWRVLRDDGCVFLNLGDTYCGYWGDKGAIRDNRPSDADRRGFEINARPKYEQFRRTGIKPKDLVGIPWRVAFALQADGWWLRSDIIWAKGLSFCDEYAGSCMPESVRDRPVKAHENVFLLAKSRRYFYDHEAVKEDAVGNDPGNTYHKGADAWFAGDQYQRTKVGLTSVKAVSKRNLRDVWAINPAGYAGAHFAVFPGDLVTPCIRAGTSQAGACPVCGAPWERVVEKELIDTEGWGPAEKDHTGNLLGAQSMIRDGKGRAGTSISETTDWQPTCDHDAKPIPCVVLDPFAGSGTTGLVARELGRDAVLLDLSHQYLAEQAAKRLELDKLRAWSKGGKRKKANLKDLPLWSEE